MSAADPHSPAPPVATSPSRNPPGNAEPGAGRESGAGDGSLLVAAVRHLVAKRWDEATAAFRTVLRVAPHRADAWDGLGTCAHNSKRFEEAERLFRRAIELRPDNPLFHDHLGVALRSLKRPAEAVPEYEKALAIDPNRPSTHNNLGNALSDIKEHERAIEALRRAVALAPDTSNFRLNLARALVACQRGKEALEHLEPLRAAASELQPDVEVEYGHALMQAERYKDAIAAYRCAAAAGSRDHGMFHNLGTALQYFGLNEEAAEAYRRALELRPDFAPSRRQLVGVRKYEALDDDTEGLQELLKSPDLSTSDRADVHMGLAKIFDDLGDHPKAFFHLQAGNQHIRSTIVYNADRNSDYIHALIDTFNRDFIAERVGFGSDSEVPLFVLGMPRSGTTLVEQILSSHPEVHGAGELKKLYGGFLDLPQRLKSDVGMPQIAHLIDRQLADEMAREYLTYVTELNPEARFVIDKMPFNFRAIGLIAVLFPKARIIHCRRDPLDIGLSCYFARFHDELTFAFNLVEIGRYYRDYERIMGHWRQVVQNRMIEVQYEQLVADPEAGARRILDFCGLGWDDRCLKFYETERAVLTASNWQVRQPVYTSSIGRWRYYRDYLDPLIAALGINASDLDRPDDTLARAS
jgi:tetratricopeptide (TPR) repeat protein